MFEIIILFLAGIGAGVVTGLAGASAVIVAAPILIIFLDYPAYLAIGISLSIDVFASLFAAIVYQRHGKIKIRSSLILLVSALLTVLAGSYFSIKISSDNLSLATAIGIILTGYFIMIKKDNATLTTKHLPFFDKYKTLSLILVGLLIGTIAGVFGAGGGIMILFSLVMILDYKIHAAIGTSVFLMIFIALFGGIAHYITMPFSILSLALGSLGGIIGAIFTSKFANSLNEDSLNKLVSFAIITLGILLVIKKIVF
jgi:hypothetical protein